MSSELCDLSAHAVRAMLRTGDISAQELLSSCLDRIENVNGTINAITAMDIERAERDAAAATERLKQNDAPPLTGIPVGIKDLNRTAGMRTTYGSLLHKDDVPDQDEALVARLRDAGAIILAKTNTPEFGSGSNTTNRVFGPTLNPHNPERTPGGSSGGSAAALASGMLPLAHGSDTGGSLRNPATWCGVVGFRPTPGLVSREQRSLGYTHFSVQGPMARNVDDIALMMTGLVGDDSRDILSAPCDPTSFLTLDQIDVSHLKVAWSTDFGGTVPVDNDIAATFKKSIAGIQHLFKSCDEAHPNFEDARDIFWILRCVYYVANHKDRVANHADLLSPTIVSNTRAGFDMSLEDVAWAERHWVGLYQEFQEFFADIDLFIVPGNAIPPFLVEEGIPTAINGIEMENYMDPSLVRSALTLTGHPVLALPCGIDHVGMPFGFQIVGKRRGDLKLLQAAAALEKEINQIDGLRVTPPDLSPYS
jgi:amidase